MSAWIKWEGGECPVDPGTIVEIECRDGEREVGRLGRAANVYFDWRHDPRHPYDADIIAYRVAAS